jgi:serine/threonine-protein kinase
MGAVYLARQTALDRAVAIKVMHGGLAADGMYAARFHREAKAASRLNHPNVIQVLDYGQEPDGLFYMAMEYLDGRDLLQVLMDDWPLSHEFIVDVLSQALAALGEAHDVGVLHRDLKPENIMVLRGKDEDGTPRNVVKVCDFGIAKIMEPEPPPDKRPSASMPAARRLTTAGLVIGTPEYMSPEQARGEPIDARSDLYSVGVILYQLLSRRLPFEGESAFDIVMKAVSSPPPPLDLFGPTCAPALDPLCAKAIAKRADERFQSAREMRAALKAASPAPRPQFVISGTAERPSVVGTLPTQAEFVAPTASRTATTGGMTQAAPSAPRSWLRWGALVGAAVAVAGVGATRLLAPPPTVTPAPVAEVVTKVPTAPSPPPPLASAAPPPAPVTAAPPATLLSTREAPSPTKTTAHGGGHHAPAPHEVAEPAPTATAPPPSIETVASSTPAPAPVPAPPPPTAIATPAPTPAAPPPPAPAPAAPPFDPSGAHVDIGAVRSNNASATSHDILRALTPLASQISSCYRASLGPAPQIPAVSTGTLHLESDDVGNVTIAKVTGGAPPAAARCIEAAAKTIRLNVDTGTANSDVPLTFKPQ